MDPIVIGPPTSELGAAIGGLFWSLAARRPIRRGLEYVNAKSNSAGEPLSIFASHASSARLLHEGPIPGAFSTACRSWIALLRASGRLRIEHSPLNALITINKRICFAEMLSLWWEA